MSTFVMRMILLKGQDYTGYENLSKMYIEWTFEQLSDFRAFELF